MKPTNLLLPVLLLFVTLVASQTICPDGEPPGVCTANLCTEKCCGAGSSCVINYCDCTESCSCTEDTDCPTDKWCRLAPGEKNQSICVPFVGEGATCGGFTLPSSQERCAPGLLCTDFPPMVADAPGRCRKPCQSQKDCGEDQYCACTKKKKEKDRDQKKMEKKGKKEKKKEKEKEPRTGSGRGFCRDDGTCFRTVDCFRKGNDYIQILCVGKTLCKGGVCSKECINTSS